MTMTNEGEEEMYVYIKLNHQPHHRYRQQQELQTYIRTQCA